MLQADQGHLILTSSHRAYNDTLTMENYFDMTLLRNINALVNNISHICTAHARKLSYNGSKNSICLCYLFSQAEHLNNSSQFRKLMNVFANQQNCSNKNNNCNDNNKINTGNNNSNNCTTKASILYEIGVIPTLGDISDTHLISNSVKLVNDDANQRFLNQVINVRSIISDNGMENRVMVYIDPSPADINRSLHAMTFVSKTITKPKQITSYVLLAVEEFSTHDILDGNAMSALALVFMGTVKVLTVIYDGFFKEFIVAPEANSITVNEFWLECSKLYSEDLRNQGIYVLATTIPIYASSGHKRQKVIQDRRIGYYLGSNKVKMICNFFSLIYNTNPKESGNCLMFSNYLWSFSLLKENINFSIPLYITDKLSLLQLKKNINDSGKHTFKISGKRKRDNCNYTQDDLPITITLSCILYDQINDSLDNLVLLQPPILGSKYDSLKVID